MRFETITGPSYLASYFINGDASGLDETELHEAAEWKRTNHVANVVGMEEDSERFTNHYRAYVPDSPYGSGDICDYYCELAPGAGDPSLPDAEGC